MIVTFTVNQEDVIKEVARKSAYIGAKKEDNKKAADEGAYERIRTVDADREELIELFDECRVEVEQSFPHNFVSGTIDCHNNNGDIYCFTVDVPEPFNRALIPSVNNSLFLFFVYGILSRWFMNSNKEEAPAYAELSESKIEAVRSVVTPRTFLRDVSTYF